MPENPKNPENPENPESQEKPQDSPKEQPPKAAQESMDATDTEQKAEETKGAEKTIDEQGPVDDQKLDVSEQKPWRQEGESTEEVSETAEDKEQAVAEEEGEKTAEPAEPKDAQAPPTSSDEEKETIEPARDQEQADADSVSQESFGESIGEPSEESSDSPASTGDEDAADLEPETLKREVLWVECAKDMVNRDCRQLLETLGMTLIPMTTTERYGESLADKWNKLSQVRFAVVCLSGDGFCYGKDGKPADSRLCSAQEKVFALGFLLAKLSRMNVFVLYYEQNTFMIPTDMQEVVYVPYNRTGSWQDLLKSRLRIVGMLE